MSVEAAERALGSLRVGLIIFTSLVAIGLVLEYKTALRLIILGLWKLLTFRSTAIDRCALRRMCWHFLGAILVTVGVAGEFWIEYEQYGAENSLTRATAAERDKLNGETAQANVQARKANERAAANEAKAASLDNENLKLRKTIEPRSLTLDQQRAIADTLHAFAGTYVDVWSLMHDPEGYLLSEQIIAAFRRGHLAVQDDAGKYTDSNARDVGVGVACPDTQQGFGKAVRKSLAPIPFDNVALIKPRPLISDAGMGKSFQPAPSFCVVFVFSKPLPVLQ